MKEKVSIVLPAYNCEKTLSKSIESIINQTYINWELIIVNDGSTDNTSEICNKYSFESRIIYIQISNQGVSNARNIGISKASGKYIVFIDSDDSYQKEYIEIMIKNMLNTQLVCCSYNYVYDDMNKITGPNLKEDLKMEEYEMINYLHQKKCLKMLWNKMFVLDIIKENDIKMNVEFNYGEDYMFVIDYLYFINNIKIINNKLYNYSIHSGGLSTKYNDNLFENRLRTLNHHKEMYLKKNMPLEYIKQQYVLAVYAELVNYSINNKKFPSEMKTMIDKYIKNEEITSVINDKFKCSTKIKILKNLLKYKINNIIYILVLIERHIQKNKKFYKSRRK